MSTFDRYSNFDKQANFTGVTFGEANPVLEVELNELQQIQNEARKDLIKDLIDGGVINDPSISYNGTALQLSEEAIVYLNGSRFVIPTSYTMEIPSTPTQLVFLEAWYKDVSFEDILTVNGGEGQPTITNNIKDNRYPIETTRRLILKWRLRNTSDLTLVATPIRGDLDTPSLVNFTKKTDNLYVGEVSGASFDGVVYAIPLVLVSETTIEKVYNKVWTDSDHKKNLEVLSSSLHTSMEDFKSEINLNLGEMDNKKINYTDLLPVVTTGTSSDYVATIPSGVTEVTIVPHINNVANAMINGIAILDREGKPIEVDTLIANIPSKLVRVGSNFFITSSSGGGVTEQPHIIRSQPQFFDNHKVIPTDMATQGGKLIYYEGYLYIASSDLLYRYNLRGDPSVETWVKLAKNPLKVSWSGVVAFRGKIYFFGTYATGQERLVYVYDIETDTYMDTGTIIPSTNFTGITPIVYKDEIYLMYSTLIWKYDTITNTFTELNRNTLNSVTRSPVALFEDKIYSFSSGSGADSRVWYYDITKNTFTDTGTPLKYRHYEGGASTIGSSIYILGAGNSDSSHIKSYEKYNCLTNTIDYGNPRMPYIGQASSYTTDGDLMYMGFSSSTYEGSYIMSFRPEKDIWYIPKGLTLSPLSSYLKPITGELVKGEDSYKITKSGEFELIPNQIWTMQNKLDVIETQIAYNPKVERVDHGKLPYYFHYSCGLRVKDTIYVFGGSSTYTDDNSNFKAFKYNTITGEMTWLADVPFSCNLTSAVYTEDGKIHLIGTNTNPYRAHYVYDIETNTYTECPTLANTACGHALGYFNGYIHIYSGYNNYRYEWNVYNIQNQTFTKVGSLIVSNPNSLHNKSVCQEGVLYIGGFSLVDIKRVYLREMRTLSISSISSTFIDDKSSVCICGDNLYTICHNSYPYVLNKCDLLTETTGTDTNGMLTNGTLPSDSFTDSVAIGVNNRMYLIGGRHDSRKEMNKFVERILKPEKIWVNGICKYLGRVIEGNGLVNIDHLR